MFHEIPSRQDAEPRERDRDKPDLGTRVRVSADFKWVNLRNNDPPRRPSYAPRNPKICTRR